MNSSIQFLLELIIYWLTTWGQIAQLKIAPAIGLHNFEVFPMKKNVFQRQPFSSVKTIENNFDIKRPLIWIR